MINDIQLPFILMKLRIDLVWKRQIVITPDKTERNIFRL